MSNMDLLYLFGFSLRNNIHLERLKKLIEINSENNKNVGIVFIHDGVIGLSSKQFIPKLADELLKSSIKKYALVPDLKARGISRDAILETIELIGYEELVDLMDSTSKIISWM